jgi:hypothetical protein
MKLLLLVTFICIAFSFASAQTIATLIANNTQLTFLNGNITAAAPALTTLLNSVGNFTYFGPNNNAFNNLPNLNSTGPVSLNDKFEPEHRKNRIPRNTGQTFGSVKRRKNYPVVNEDIPILSCNVVKRSD